MVDHECHQVFPMLERTVHDPDVSHRESQMAQCCLNEWKEFCYGAATPLTLKFLLGGWGKVSQHLKSQGVTLTTWIQDWNTDGSQFQACLTRWEQGYTGWKLFYFSVWERDPEGKEYIQLFWVRNKSHLWECLTEDYQEMPNLVRLEYGKFPEFSGDEFMDSELTPEREESLCAFLKAITEMPTFPQEPSIWDQLLVRICGTAEWSSEKLDTAPALVRVVKKHLVPEKSGEAGESGKSKE